MKFLFSPQLPPVASIDRLLEVIVLLDGWVDPIQGAGDLRTYPAASPPDQCMVLRGPVASSM